MEWVDAIVTCMQWFTMIYIIICEHACKYIIHSNNYNMLWSYIVNLWLFGYRTINSRIVDKLTFNHHIVQNYNNWIPTFYITNPYPWTNRWTGLIPHSFMTSSYNVNFIITMFIHNKLYVDLAIDATYRTIVFLKIIHAWKI